MLLILINMKCENGKYDKMETKIDNVFCQAKWEINYVASLVRALFIHHCYTVLNIFNIIVHPLWFWLGLLKLHQDVLLRIHNTVSSLCKLHWVPLTSSNQVLIITQHSNIVVNGVGLLLNCLLAVAGCSLEARLSVLLFNIHAVFQPFFGISAMASVFSYCNICKFIWWVEFLPEGPKLFINSFAYRYFWLRLLQEKV